MTALTKHFRNSILTGVLLTTWFMGVNPTFGSCIQKQAGEVQTKPPSNKAGGFPPSMKLAAEAVRASTVTIRVDRYTRHNAIRKDEVPDESTETNFKSKAQAGGRLETDRSVAVFSGVLVKQGFVAAPLFLPHPGKPDVRITVPNGEQVIGRPRILDEYSGLAIISINDHTIPCLKCCSSADPIVGDWVVSGAAWGRQEALVSLGMISGIGYRLPSARIESPPMIVCDLRAAVTSKGAGVVSANGKLIGILMAVSSDRKWTYVVPASHVKRLLRSLALHQNSTAAESGDIYVLKRQVPRLGVRVDNVSRDRELGLYDVVIESVVKDGAAAQAGLQKGDRIKSVNGKAVRAWYDVVRDCLNRQPGDRIELVIVRNSKPLQIAVVLGGGFAAHGKTIEKLHDYIRPEIDLNQYSNPDVIFRNSSLRFNQLINYSLENLSPTPCLDPKTIQELADSLKNEREKNSKLQTRVEKLESQLNRLIKQIEK